MAVSATINLSLSALDTSSQDSCEAEKKCSLSSAASIESAVVAIASGTCGTTAVSVDFSDYRESDGGTVDFTQPYPSIRVAFVANPSAALDWDNATTLRMTSRNDEVAVSSLPTGSFPLTLPPLEIKTVPALFQTAFTASYTVMLLREA